MSESNRYFASLTSNLHLENVELILFTYVALKIFVGDRTFNCK